MDEALRIRTAGPADAASVGGLTRAAYARWVSVIGREPLPMLADYDRAVREHRIDLFEGETGLVALAELAPHADHLLIVNLAVAPEAQGRGLGRRLLDHAEAVARQLALPQLRLYTNGRMAANIRLYSSVGYRITEEEVRAPDWVVVYMAKPLA